VKDGFLEFSIDGMKVVERVREVPVKKPMLMKFYAATNTILSEIASNRLKSKIDRNIKVNDKHLENENQFPRENKEEYKENQQKVEDKDSLYKKGSNKSNEGKSEIKDEEERESLVEADNGNIVKRNTGDSKLKERVDIQKMDSLMLDEEELSMQVQSITWPKHATFLQKLFWAILFPSQYIALYNVDNSKDGKR
jgi:hypothetical protein